MAMRLNDADCIQGLTFIGDTLGPLFLNDPKTGEAGALFEAFATLDVDSAALEWPFTDRDEVAKALEKMQQSLAGGVHDDLMWEYRRLFVGPVALSCPPWGSVYTDRDCVVFGESMFALRRWLRSHNVVYKEKEKLPEDHIGTQLELMSWIARNQPEHLEEYLCLHLFTWSSHYLTQLQSAAQHPFYEGLSCLTRQSLEGIERCCEMKVSYPNYYR